LICVGDAVPFLSQILIGDKLQSDIYINHSVCWFASETQHHFCPKL